ncbi:sugar ABC transporter substrate-binding protein, partial [Halobellus sp. Atlit-38R]
MIAIAGCTGGGDGSGSGSDGEGSGEGGGDTQSVQLLTMGVGDNIKQFFEEN